MKSIIAGVSLASTVATRSLAVKSNDTYMSLLTNHDNTEYSTTVYVGSKQQAMKLVIDITASAMWFAGPNCPET
jgi:hypothetical protein